MCKWLQRPLAGDLVQAVQNARAEEAPAGARARLRRAGCRVSAPRRAGNKRERRPGRPRASRGSLRHALRAAPRRRPRRTCTAPAPSSRRRRRAPRTGCTPGRRARLARRAAAAARRGRFFFSEKERKMKRNDGERDDDAADADARLGRASAVAERRGGAVRAHAQGQVLKAVVSADRRRAASGEGGETPRETAPPTRADRGFGFGFGFGAVSVRRRGGNVRRV